MHNVCITLFIYIISNRFHAILSKFERGPYTAQSYQALSLCKQLDLELPGILFHYGLNCIILSGPPQRNHHQIEIIFKYAKHSTRSHIFQQIYALILSGYKTFSCSTQLSMKF